MTTFTPLMLCIVNITMLHTEYSPLNGNTDILVWF